MSGSTAGKQLNKGAEGHVPAPGGHLGRFELRRILGQGAQGQVWLAFDPRLEREVALKILHADPLQAQPAAHAWLREARIVSKLHHPHVLPLFEADIHEGQAYLVFEFVPGRNLAETLRARGALPVHEAVELMLGVLKALAAAHQAGIVHRDLKPSNILIDGQGQARVMDFGIATAAQEGASAPWPLPGTPAYQAPEAFEGAAASAAMDVFSAGLVLIEALCGQTLVQETEPRRILAWMKKGGLQWPPGQGEAADDALRAIALRAISMDPALRYSSAQDMFAALQAWVPPAASEMAPAPRSASLSGTLDFLLRRMRHRSDFPAMSESVHRIHRIASNDQESLATLCDEILKDVALTNKLLRLVNTAYYAGVTGGNVSTVSRAVALVGFSGIRNMALSLILLEHMQDKAHASQLKEEFLRTLLAAAVATEACTDRAALEEAFLGAMFLNLGRMLTDYYFPEEARLIRTAAAASDSPRAEEAAAISVLGLGFEELGVAVAQSWGLPESLVACMRKPTGEPPKRRPEPAGERLRWLALAGNKVADAVLGQEPGHATARIERIAQRHSGSLGISAAEFLEAVKRARVHLLHMAKAMNLAVSPGSPASRLLREPTVLGVAAAGASVALGASVVEAGRGHTLPLAAAPPSQAVALLAAGIQDVSNAMVDGAPLSDVLRTVLETLFRALHLQRVVFCLREARGDTLSGRYGIGEGVSQQAKLFRVPLNDLADFFGAVCQSGRDTLIADASIPQVAARMPAWWRQHFQAPSFAVLPLQMKGNTFGLIYADVAQAGSLKVGTEELALVRTLRNQATLAFKQAV